MSSPVGEIIRGRSFGTVVSAVGNVQAISSAIWALQGQDPDFVRNLRFKGSLKGELLGDHWGYEDFKLRSNSGVLMPPFLLRIPTRSSATNFSSTLEHALRWLNRNLPSWAWSSHAAPA